MNVREIAWRAGRAGQKIAARNVDWTSAADRALPKPQRDWDDLLRQFRASTGRPVLLDRERARSIAAESPDGVAAVVAAAELLLTGEVAYFGYPAVNLGPAVDWNLDPISGVRWPTLPADKIDHRTAQGDPKWIWELNRLQHLPLLAEAWLFTDDDRFAEAAFTHLDSWIGQNEPGVGIAWRGAFECGIRATSVAIALQGLRDSPALTTERYRRVAALLNESASRCWRERSLFSSANNHLIGELTGLATVAILFPELDASTKWEQNALDLLGEHSSLQILADGSGAEQAVGYQVFTAELLAVVDTLLTLRGDPSRPAIRDAIVRSARYLAALVGTDDPQPRYGDDDEGFALRLGPEPLRTVRDHLGIVAALTGDSAAQRCGRTTITSTWLRAALGTKAAADDLFDASADSYSPNGGLVVLRGNGRRVTMDVGPLGFLSIAAHGHADALAVTLSVDGEDVIGDPGAGAYYGHPHRRVAYRGTRMHGTVCVDDVDQSVIGGPFMWTDQADVEVRAVDLSRGIVDAEHNGYLRLTDPVVHRRWLIAADGLTHIAIVDLISGTGSHSAQANWPLHPSCDAAPVENGHLISRDGVGVLQLAYAATGSFAVVQVRGDEADNLGWWSERLEQQEPAWLVGARIETPAPSALLTVLKPLDQASTGPVKAQRIQVIDDRIEIGWIDGTLAHGAVIDVRTGGAIATSP